MDLFGPVETPSNLGYKYCLRVRDGFSRFVWTLFLKSKFKVSFLLQKLFTQIENQSHAKITNIVSNNGSEFKNEKLNNLLQAKGITHLTTAPYKPQQNPFAEQGNRTTVTKARCLLRDSGLGGTYWAEAVRTATYLQNITPKRSLDHSTPFRYEEGHRAYRILDRRTDLNQTLATKHEEGNPPQKNNLEMGSPTPPESNLEPDPVEDLPEVIPSRAKPPSLSRSDNPEPNPSRLAKGKSPRYKWIPENEQPPKEILGKVGDPRNVMESQRRPKHTANAVSLLDEECPKNFHQAMKSNLHQHWEDAIQKELDNMEKHQVWSPATLTENTKALSTTWVFKRKTNEDGNLTKFKTRLC
ncbi:hypothetical protein O181_097564, partial [Austropuccinia psidii MF-1]|nr:hypothetical protein [Austropuccinia psidii MF-1]